MNLILAMWTLAVLGAGACATLIVWRQWKHSDLNNTYSRYEILLFTAIAIGRVIRLYAMVSSPVDLPDDRAIKDFIASSVEAAGLWAYYLCLMGMFTGKWQERVYKKIKSRLRGKKPKE